MSEEQIARLLQQISGLHETLDKTFRHFKLAQENGARFDIAGLEDAAELYWQLRRIMDGLIPIDTSDGLSGGSMDLDFV